MKSQRPWSSTCNGDIEYRSYEPTQNIQGAKAPAIATGKAQDSDGDV